MKKKINNEEIGLKPIMPIGELYKKFREAKTEIQQGLLEGRQEELKKKYKFITSL